MRYYALEKLINLHDGYRKSIKIDQHNLLLIQQDGERFLIEDRCPHRGHPLAEASIEGGRIQCPLHGYQFELASGSLNRFSEEPCRGLLTYDLVYEAREVGVMI